MSFLTAKPGNSTEVLDGEYRAYVADELIDEPDYVAIRYDHDGSTADALWRELSPA